MRRKVKKKKEMRMLKFRESAKTILWFIKTNSWLFFLILFFVLELYLHRFSFIFLLLLNLPPPSSCSSSPVLLPYSHWSTIFIFFWLFVRYFLENEEFVFINQRIVLADSRNFNILISFFFLTFLLILYYFLSFLHTFFLQLNIKPIRNIDQNITQKKFIKCFNLIW